MESNTALAFVRVSTGSQDESTQVTTLEDYAGDHGIKIVETVILHGYSASHGTQEPALLAAIEGIGRYHLIMVTDSSRLDRREDLDAQAEILLAIRQAGGDVISTTEPQFGKTDFAGRVVTLVAQYGNAEKSRTVKNQTWRGVKAIMANHAMYGHLPVFWNAVGERYAKVAVCTNPDAVKDVYESVKGGQSLSSIARKYDTYPQSIRRLVRTEANYTGIFECRYTYGGEPYTWQHSTGAGPVVDRELWHDANRVMGERGAILNRTGGRPVQQARSWISGLIPCPHCNGNLYVSRGKYLQCSGKGKDRRSCGVHGIDLDYVTRQIEEIISDPDTKVYRYTRVSGNQGELDELKAELQRVRDTLAITDDDDEFDRLSARRKELRKSIDEFELVPETYEMTPTGDTLLDLWKTTSDKRDIFRALQRRIGFNVGWSDRPEQAAMVNGYVWIEGFYPGNELIELTDDICIKMHVPETGPAAEWRRARRHRAA